MTANLLSKPILCLVTDRKLCPNKALVEKISLAVEGGVNMVQVREKDMSTDDLLELAKAIQYRIRNRALLIVNGDVDVALGCGADGLHIGKGYTGPISAPTTVSHNLILGRSVHSVEDAKASQVLGADYLIAGSVFATESHPGRIPSGIRLIEDMASSICLPYLGIGGINSCNAAQVVIKGASGVAVIRAILSSDQPGESARTLCNVINKAWDLRVT